MILYIATRLLARTVKENSTRKGVNQILSANDLKSGGNKTREIRFDGSDRANPKVTLVKVLPNCNVGAGYGFVPIAYKDKCI